jgi:hypothetical protein
MLPGSSSLEAIDCSPLACNGAEARGNTFANPNEAGDIAAGQLRSSFCETQRN